MPVPKLVDSLRGWVGFKSLQTRWAIKSGWRRLRGRHGAFKQGEVSARSAHLTDLWDQTWRMASPLGYELRIAYSDQWVRFHSLPESKRYAESDAEYAEILRRHRTVLQELHGSADLTDLWVIAVDWGSDDLAAGWSKGRLPSAWPWQRRQAEDDPDAGFNYFWASSGLADASIDSLLLAIADDEGRLVIGAPDLEWLYCPCDGGADVLLPTAVGRDALKERHADWLPAHPQGL